MTLPKDPFTITGGCNCKAIRYKVDVPTWDDRPPTFYKTPDEDVGDLRFPMTAIDHCNDCRRATSSVIGMWLCAHYPTISVKCLPRSQTKDTRKADEGWVAASEIFDNDASPLAKDTFLTFYRSSPAKIRSFCGRCGTAVSYAIDPAKIPGFPRILDIPLGTVDQEFLEKEWMKPERRLWCQVGVPWVNQLVKRGVPELPAHPTWKIDQEWHD